MRTQNMYLPLMALVMVQALAFQAWGQADQYKRAKKKASSSEGVAAPTGGAPTDAKSEKKSDDKVDISDLEQKYWAPKDVEFNVVQNRLYSKAGRFGATVAYGPLVTDSFSSGGVLGVSANYYWSERYGAELHYSNYYLRNSQVAEGFITDNRTVPDFNRQVDYTGAAFNWVPIYAKLSLLEKKILYFDMSLSPGIGVMRYDQIREGGSGTTQSTPALSLDVAQHYFLSKEFAFRLDMRNRFYNEDVIKYRTGEFVKTKGTHSVTVQFGLTFYFGGEGG